MADFNPEEYVASEVAANTGGFNPEEHVQREVALADQQPIPEGFDPEQHVVAQINDAYHTQKDIMAGMEKAKALSDQVYQEHTTHDQRMQALIEKTDQEKQVLGWKVAAKMLGTPGPMYNPLLNAALTKGGGAGDVVAQLAPAIAGGMSPVPGGLPAGMLAGNALKQARQTIRGERPEGFSLPEMGVTTAMGAFPLGEIEAAATPLGTLAKTMLTRTAQVEALGIGATTAQSLLERGEMPSTEEMKNTIEYSPLSVLPFATIEGLQGARATPYAPKASRIFTKSEVQDQLLASLRGEQAKVDIMPQIEATTDRLAANGIKNRGELTKATTEISAPSAPTPTTFKTQGFTVNDLGGLVGRRVEYAGYRGTLIRDAEGNFVVLRDVRTPGEPAEVEVEGAGKDEGAAAFGLGVKPLTETEQVPPIGRATPESIKTQADINEATRIAQLKQNEPISVDKPGLVKAVNPMQQAMEEAQRIVREGSEEMPASSGKAVISDLLTSAKIQEAHASTKPEAVPVPSDQPPRYPAPLAEGGTRDVSKSASAKSQGAAGEPTPAQVAADAQRTVRNAAFTEIYNALPPDQQKVLDALVVKMNKGLPLSHAEADTATLMEGEIKRRMAVSATQVLGESAPAQPVPVKPQAAAAKPAQITPNVILGTPMEKWATSRVQAIMREGRTMSPTPSDMAALTIHTAARIEQGLHDFESWSRQVVQDLGEWVKPQLETLWKSANSYLNQQRIRWNNGQFETATPQTLDHILNTKMTVAKDGSIPSQGVYNLLRKAGASAGEIEYYNSRGLGDLIKGERTSAAVLKDWVAAHAPKAVVKTLDNSGVANETAYKYATSTRKPQGYAEILVRAPVQPITQAERSEWEMLSEKGSTLGQRLTPSERLRLSNLTKQFDTLNSPLFTGPHFGDNDINTLAFTRGHLETLPSGEKAWVVDEIQSDWGQRLAAAKQIEADEAEMGIPPAQRVAGTQVNHPLLEHYKTLAIKAAINHALEVGADKIFLPDAETAMMTEMHDRNASTQIVVQANKNNQEWAQHFLDRMTPGRRHANRSGLNDDVLKKLASGTDHVIDAHLGEVGSNEVMENLERRGWTDSYLKTSIPQEAGMRAAYDVDHPNLAQKITGQKGEPTELGYHRDVEQEKTVTANLSPENTKIVGSPVFKDAQGNPKTNVTGWTYDIKPNIARMQEGVKPVAPATYLGYQEGAGSVKGFDLYNLTKDIPGHPTGSTVSAQTLEEAGFSVPPKPGMGSTAGNINVKAMAPLGGGAAGAAIGFVSGDTPADKIQRAALYGAIGAAVGYGGIKAIESAQQSNFKAGDTLRNMWDQSKVRGAITYLRDAYEGSAIQVAREKTAVIGNALNEAFAGGSRKLAADALSVVVESKGDRNAISDMIAKVASSTEAIPQWKDRFLAAAQFAQAHYDELTPTAQAYKVIHDAQALYEQSHGIETLNFDGYVAHRGDVATNLTNPLASIANRGGISAPFTRIRDYQTFADLIAAGGKPETLNAEEAMLGRMVNGNKLVGQGLWLNSMTRYMDAAKEMPMLGQTTTRTRANGTTYREAADPANYDVRKVGSTEFAISNNFSSTFDALNDPSWFMKSPGWAAALKLNSLGKSARLMIDSYHFGRIAAMESIGHLAAGHAPIPSFLKSWLTGESMNILDNTPEEIARIGAGEGFAPERIQQLLTDHQNYHGLINGGMVMGGVEDAAHQDIIHAMPVAGAFNKYLFGSYQRAAMQHVGLEWLESNAKMYPDLSQEDLYRKTAQEVNIWFRNLGRQGIIRSATGRDAARMLILAPQWNEGAIWTEAGAVTGAAKNLWEATKGEGFHLGMLPRAVGTMIGGQFVANQIINQYYRHCYTWENPEEGIGAKLSAWVPDYIGGGPGFFLNPLSIAAEFTHTIMNKYDKTEDLGKSIAQTAVSRLSALAQPVLTTGMVNLTNQDLQGRTVNPSDTWGSRGRLAAVGRAGIPLPIPATAVSGTISSLTSGERQEQWPGEFQGRLMSSAGLRTDAAPSPVQRISRLARSFNEAHKVDENPQYSETPFTNVKKYLIVNNHPDAEKSMNDLLDRETPERVEAHFQGLPNYPFTMNKAREQEFIATLTLDQLRVYLRALSDRTDIATRGTKLLIDTLVKRELAKRAEGRK